MTRIIIKSSIIFRDHLLQKRFLASLIFFKRTSGRRTPGRRRITQNVVISVIRTTKTRVGMDVLQLQLHDVLLVEQLHDD